MNVKKISLLFSKYVLNETSFKIVMIVILCPLLVPYLHGVLGGYIKYALLFGLIICFYQIIIKKNITALCKNKINFPYFIFLVLYAFSIFLNRNEYGFTNNIKQLTYMAVFFVCFNMLGHIREKKYLQTEMIVISVVYVVMSFILSLASYITCLLGISYSYEVNDTLITGDNMVTLFVMGVSGGRLAGVLNANATAMISLLSLLVTFLLLNSCLSLDNKFKKSVGIVFLVINAWVQFVCLMLSGSRAAIYVFYLALAIIVFRFAIVHLNKGNKYVKCTLSIVLAFVVFVVLFSATNVMRSILFDFSDIKNNIASMLSTTSSNVAVSSISNREDISSDYSTGRFKIWLAALEILKNKPLLGYTREGFIFPVYNYLLANYGYYARAVIYSGLHNIYLTVLLSSGLFGFLTFVFIIGRTLIHFLVKIRRFLFEDKLFYSALIVISFLIVEFVESRILYEANIFNVMFWIYFGYLTYFSFEKKDLVEA